MATSPTGNTGERCAAEQHHDHVRALLQPAPRCGIAENPIRHSFTLYPNNDIAFSVKGEPTGTFGKT